jgi:ATP-dependent RNA helicase DDX47/RRP3
MCSCLIADRCIGGSELAYQISEQFCALGASIGLKCAVIVGGMGMCHTDGSGSNLCLSSHHITYPYHTHDPDVMEQAVTLSKGPHVIIGTPGRVAYHLENTNGFTLDKLHYLVMDEADRLLNMDFEEDINKIIALAPDRDVRRTYLFSATMTTKVEKLKRASLKDPVKVQVDTKYESLH